MAFENLTEKLQRVFKQLRSKGRLTEADVKAALKEVKLALLEADVNFRVVKEFVRSVEERAIGADVMNGLNPGQMVIKIVNEEMTALMGSETTELKLEPGQAQTIVMMCGLQGAGKTTTAAKIAGKLKQKGKKSLLVACDVYRPAAIEQLKINGQKQDVDVFAQEDCKDPVQIARDAIAFGRKNGHQIILLDTAGRLQIDEEMMRELMRIRDAVGVHQTLLVVDAMTGQEAVNVAKSFADQVGVDGIVLSKMDGDARGGAALSVKAVTGKPILFVGMGEKLSDLEQFYPDRMASRILGMGDVLSLIEKAEKSFDEKKATELAEKLKKHKFTLADYYDQLVQLRSMGSLEDIAAMIPGMSGLKGVKPDEDIMKKTEAIILSMTPKERENPNILGSSRKKRIAAGSGTNVTDLNRLLKQYEMMNKMIRSMTAPGIKRKKLGKMGGFPGMSGFPGF